MAADLHVHVMTDDCTEEVLDIFFRNTLGHKRSPGLVGIMSAPQSHADWERSYEIISHTPNAWVGEVSWLKAALAEDDKTYVPDLVQAIHDLMEDEPVIDDELIARVKDAYAHAGNITSYSTGKADEVVNLLELFKGHRAFTVSW